MAVEYLRLLQLAIFEQIRNLNIDTKHERIWSIRIFERPGFAGRSTCSTKRTAVRDQRLTFVASSETLTRQPSWPYLGGPCSQALMCTCWMGRRVGSTVRLPLAMCVWGYASPRWSVIMYEYVLLSGRWAKVENCGSSSNQSRKVLVHHDSCLLPLNFTPFAYLPESREFSGGNWCMVGRSLGLCLKLVHQCEKTSHRCRDCRNSRRCWAPRQGADSDIRDSQKEYYIPLSNGSPANIL